MKHFLVGLILVIAFLAGTAHAGLKTSLLHSNPDVDNWTCIYTNTHGRAVNVRFRITGQPVYRKGQWTVLPPFLTPVRRVEPGKTYEWIQNILHGAKGEVRIAGEVEEADASKPKKGAGTGRDSMEPDRPESKPTPGTKRPPAPAVDIPVNEKPTWTNPPVKTDREKGKDANREIMRREKAAEAARNGGAPVIVDDAAARKAIVGTWKAGPREDLWNKNILVTIEFRTNGTGRYHHSTEFKRPRGGAPKWVFEFDFQYRYAGGGKFEAKFSAPRVLEGDGMFAYPTQPSLSQGVYTVAGGMLTGTRALEKRVQPFQKVR